jgi:hypothetical protein
VSYLDGVVARMSLRYSLRFFTLSRLLLVVIGLITLMAFPDLSTKNRITPAEPLLDMWGRWDTGWYLNIARVGYFYDPTQQSAVAFFPLYPLLFGTLNIVVNNLPLSAIIVSNVSFVVALMLLYELAKLKLGSTYAAQLIVLYLCLTPNTFFLSAIYTESLFLLCSVACMLACERKQWGWATLVAACASATRLVGVFLWVFLMIEWLKTYRKFPQTRQEWTSLLVIQLAPMGLLLYMLFLWITFNDPLVFLKTQTFWYREVSNPFAVIIDNFLGIVNGDRVRLWWVVEFELGVALTSLALLPRIWQKLGASYFFLSLILIVIPLASSTLSFNRFALVIVPLWLALASFSLGRWKSIVFGVLTVLSAIIFFSWVMGFFVG